MMIRMDTICAAGRTFTVERAIADDVPALVDLLVDDVLGATREGGDLAPYVDAFHAVDADPAQFLAAVRDDAGAVVATFQLTLIPGLSLGGTTRLQIEAVHVTSTLRSAGLGTAMMEWAHDYGRARGAGLAQLTSNRSRADAHRFYERLGYSASHTGMKKPL